MRIKSIFLTLTISLAIGFLSGIVIGLIIGVKITNPTQDEVQKISTTVVLERLKDQAFLITRTVISDEETTIKIDQGSEWSNLWWGHEITAEGLMQVDVGVDLSNLTEEDIVVNDLNKTIKINLPDAEVYNSSLEGEIQVSKKSGIMRKLFATDDNEDYNLALSELSREGEASVSQNTDLMQDAKSSALSTLQVILKDTEYTISEYK